jgi:hypothetical protein
MDSNQDQFLRDEFFSLTLMGTVQRAHVYAKDSTEKARKPFQGALRAELERLENEYREPVGEETHVQNILRLSSHLSSNHAKILQNGCFRVGLAQKALNLYLKYLWCLGIIPEPPHCPFDSLVISRLRDYHGPKSWVFLKTEDQYRALIRAAKATAEGVSLATWELKLYNAS